MLNSEDDTFNALRNPPTEDEIAFGRGVWIYCAQHLRPHVTGWCGVHVSQKTKLVATTDLDAYKECKAKFYHIYDE